MKIGPTLLAAALAIAASPADAARPSRWSLSLENGRPSGWVQVRENAIDGTRLHFADDLNVRRLSGIELAARKTLGARGQWHLALASYTLDGHTVLAQPVDFNGTTIAAGALRTATGFPHFLRFDTSWWRRLAGSAGGPSLWGSVGLTFMMLNFRLHGTVAPNSAGTETKEDFDTQELPVPVLGLHVRYPLGRGWRLTASGQAGHLPWVNSLRREGGIVRLAQTDVDAAVGFETQLTAGWRFGVAAFSRNYAQHERSREDGNVIHLRDQGLRIGISHPF